jgi:hypothetical protein
MVRSNATPEGPSPDVERTGTALLVSLNHSEMMATTLARKQLNENRKADTFRYKCAIRERCDGIFDLGNPEGILTKLAKKLRQGRLLAC